MCLPTTKFLPVFAMLASPPVALNGQGAILLVPLFLQPPSVPFQLHMLPKVGEGGQLVTELYLAWQKQREKEEVDRLGGYAEGEAEEASGEEEVSEEEEGEGEDLGPEEGRRGRDIDLEEEDGNGDHRLAAVSGNWAIFLNGDSAIAGAVEPPGVVPFSIIPFPGVLMQE